MTFENGTNPVIVIFIDRSISGSLQKVNITSRKHSAERRINGTMSATGVYNFRTSWETFS